MLTTLLAVIGAERSAMGSPYEVQMAVSRFDVACSVESVLQLNKHVKTKGRKNTFFMAQDYGFSKEMNCLQRQFFNVISNSVRRLIERDIASILGASGWDSPSP